MPFLEIKGLHMEGAVAIIAYYNEETGKWVDLETAGFVAADGTLVSNTAMSHVGHFTYFAVLAKMPAGSTSSDRPNGNGAYPEYSGVSPTSMLNK